MTFDEALPVIFMVLMGISMLVYVISDGYDLGVGMLMHRATPAEKDVMIASIGPFWDANETWLVLGVGILLVAFPKAHGLVLTELYLPVMLMLIGVFHFVAGIVAIANDTFFVVGHEYVFKFDVTTWGWIHLVLGSDIQHNSDPG